ncbi:BnaA09g26280D [Brassica napus]|uniref:BnaA09g26280D protein n=1 Tax=Brassica napus TaxID=3708 RepID=A0A078GM60_BRANA|nr:BnaA09g26280D [Brassica napus]
MLFWVVISGVPNHYKKRRNKPPSTRI